MKVVVACDSFKGSLTSLQAGEAVKAGVIAAVPNAEVRVLPMADGGEGSIDAIHAACGGSFHRCKVAGPDGVEVDARWLLSADGATAWIESAAACGLPLVVRHLGPMFTTTRGVGQLIVDALDCGVTSIVLCMGGSATVDGGAGMLQALGARLLDKDGRDIGPGAAGLLTLAKADLSGLDSRLKGCTIELLTDTDAPLLGKHGAAYTFGLQKGATLQQLPLMDAALRNMCRVLGIPAECQCGAAGGLGAPLIALTGASLRSGADAILDMIGFDRILSNSDLVITGEGRMDATTLTGKTPYAVMRRGLRTGVPVVAFAGDVSGKDALLSAGFSDAVQFTPEGTDRANALDPVKAAERLRTAVEKKLKG